MNISILFLIVSYSQTKLQVSKVAKIDNKDRYVSNYVKYIDKDIGKLEYFSFFGMQFLTNKKLLL